MKATPNTFLLATTIWFAASHGAMAKEDAEALNFLVMGDSGDKVVLFSTIALHRRKRRQQKV